MTMTLQTATAATSLDTGAVGGDGSNILNATDLHASASQSTESRLSAGTGGLGAVASSSAELDVQSSDTDLFTNQQQW